jgi:hypothetical protein
MKTEGNLEWNQGFFDGHNGVPHASGKGEDYDDGYRRGYETAEIESAMTEDQ